VGQLARRAPSQRGRQAQGLRRARARGRRNPAARLRKTPPQDNFVSRLSSDWRYERALQGVRLLVQHHTGMLVQNLMAWRQQVTEDIKKAYSSGGAAGGGVLNVQGICKRVRRGPMGTQGARGRPRPSSALAGGSVRARCSLDVAAGRCSEGCSEGLPGRRQRLLCGATRAAARPCAPRRQAAMEIVFLEACLVVLEEFRPDFFLDRLFCLFFDNMQQ
jgi:hypothetical protein